MQRGRVAAPGLGFGMTPTLQAALVIEPNTTPGLHSPLPTKDEGFTAIRSFLGPDFAGGRLAGGSIGLYNPHEFFICDPKYNGAGALPRLFIGGSWGLGN